MNYKDFKLAAKKGNRVAVTETLLADLDTPVSCFLKLASKSPNCFLLESAEQADHVGRYSIIGAKPESILEANHQNHLFEIREKKRTRLDFKGDLVDLIKERMKYLVLANPEVLDGFTGGYVGFLSYENVGTFDDVLLKSLPGRDHPNGVFFLCDEFVIFDHFKKQIKIVHMANIENSKDLEETYRFSCARIKDLSKQFERQLKIKKVKRQLNDTAIQSNMTKSSFMKKVKKIKEYIRAGDCIQVVLSQKFRMKARKDDFRVYRALRSINPSPYMFYFRYGAFRLVGASPEVLVKKQDRVAEVRPIAGTRPRGKTLKEDLKYEENLRRSKKELAEHLMLVDLGRNDLGRVCEYDSVHVQNFARVERYSHVMHLVSDVVGKLRSNQTSFQLLKATFPAGTVSGAPKIRAMQIINELEPEKRGPYAGCLGYFSMTGDMDMCITIRTLAIDEDGIYLQAGAGIVKDSNPAKEYEETVNKAKALMTALESQGEIYAIDD